MNVRMDSLLVEAGVEDDMKYGIYYKTVM